MVTATRTALALALALPLSAGACGALGGDKKDDTKADDKKADDNKAEAAVRDPETSLDKVAKGPDLSGPKPPETSAVFYTVDGALIPLACFDKGKGKILAGKACAGIADKERDVYLKSAFSAEFDKLGEPKHALCEGGSAGKPTSVAVAKVDAGQAFDFAVWPKSAGQGMIEFGEDTQSEDAHKIPSGDRDALTAAITGHKKGATGEVSIHQVAAADIDGDGKDERFYSAFVVDAKDSAKFAFSGLFMRPGASPDDFVLVEETRTRSEVFTLRGAIDLDGDGSHELWVNATFSEGGGDRLYTVKGGKPAAIGKWSCGL